jgi:hypothetical protein
VRLLEPTEGTGATLLQGAPERIAAQIVEIVRQAVRA